MAGSTAFPQMKSGSVDSRPGGGHSCPGTAVGVGESDPMGSNERDDWLSILSHELRTPVAVALGHLRLLLAEGEAPLSPSQYEMTKTAEQYCARLDRFIANLIDVSYAGSVESTLDLTPGDLGAVIDQAHGMLAPLLLQKEIDLRVEMVSSPDAVHFDEVRITHVFTNLLTNALAVTEAGGLIRIECAPVEQEMGSFMECRVIDEGPGVDDGDREKIFQVFERGSSPRTNSGRGLGLALCRRIIEAHGGSIRVEDGAGCGSIFSFTLPASLAPEGSMPSVVSAETETGSHHGKGRD